jgi:hypothetical protein
MTVHEQAAERTVTRMLTAGGSQAEILTAALRSVTAGIVADSVIDVMGRPYGGGRPESWPLAQLYCIGFAHASINSGAIGRTEIAVPGDGPGPDREREANQAALAQLCRPFTATVDMGQMCADSDGTLSWDEPVVVLQATPPPGYRGEETPKYVRRDVVVRPGSVPLEIGSTTPSRTLMHLHESGGVARWPYGASTLHLWLADLDRWAAPQLAATAVTPEGGKAGRWCRPAPAAWQMRVSVAARIKV